MNQLTLLLFRCFILGDNIDISTVTNEWGVLQTSACLGIFLPLEILVFLFQFEFIFLLLKCMGVDANKWFRLDRVSSQIEFTI